MRRDTFERAIGGRGPGSRVRRSSRHVLRAAVHLDVRQIGAARPSELLGMEVRAIPMKRRPWARGWRRRTRLRPERRQARCPAPVAGARTCAGTAPLGGMMPSFRRFPQAIVFVPHTARLWRVVALHVTPADRGNCRAGAGPRRPFRGRPRGHDEFRRRERPCDAKERLGPAASPGACARFACCCTPASP